MSQKAPLRCLNIRKFYSGPRSVLSPLRAQPRRFNSTSSSSFEKKTYSLSGVIISLSLAGISGYVGYTIGFDQAKAGSNNNRSNSFPYQLKVEDEPLSQHSMKPIDEGLGSKKLIDYTDPGMSYTAGAMSGHAASPIEDSAVGETKSIASPKSPDGSFSEAGVHSYSLSSNDKNESSIGSDIKKKASEVLHQAKDIVVDIQAEGFAAHTSAEKIANVSEKLQDRFLPKKDHAANKINEMSTAASEKVSEGAESAKSGINSTVSSLKDKLEDISNDASYRVAAINDKVQQSYEKIGKEAKELGHDAETKFKQTKEAISDKLTKGQEKAQQKAQQTEQSAKKLYNDVEQEMADLKNDVKGKYSDAKETAVGKAKELQDKGKSLQDSAESKARSLKDSVENKANSLQEATVNVKDEVENSMEDLENGEGQQEAFNPETGEINWDCPCLGGMAHGPCGEQFKAAFSCFVFSEQEPKGIECVDRFQLMQECFNQHPEVYAPPQDDEDDMDYANYSNYDDPKDQREAYIKA